MKTEQILVLMILLGAFTFISMGLCAANSIEAYKSKKVANIMTVLTIIGMLSFLVGLCGVLILSI